MRYWVEGGYLNIRCVAYSISTVYTQAIAHERSANPHKSYNNNLFLFTTVRIAQELDPDTIKAV